MDVARAEAALGAVPGRARTVASNRSAREAMQLHTGPSMTTAAEPTFVTTTTTVSRPAPRPAQAPRRAPASTPAGAGTRPTAPPVRVLPGPKPAPPVTTTTLPVHPRPAPNPPTPKDPSASIPPSEAYQQSCWVSQPDLQACNQAALADIDEARAGEGLGSIQLPSGFYGLPTNAQLVAVANAERTSRGLPALSESPRLDASAEQGAASGEDPTGPSGHAWAANYALGDPTALAADFNWMYDDGPGSDNADCTATDHAGCWGHRNDILSPWPGSAGGGAATYQDRQALTQLFVSS